MVENTKISSLFSSVQLTAFELGLSTDEVIRRLGAIRVEGKLFDSAPPRASHGTESYKHIIGYALGVKWGRRAYDVHHINKDRSDNRVENLVLLPRKLHVKYHLFCRLADEALVNMKDVESYKFESTDIFRNLDDIKREINYIISIERDAIVNRKIDPTFDSIDFLEKSLLHPFKKYL